MRGPASTTVISSSRSKARNRLRRRASAVEGQPRIRGHDVVIAEQPEIGQQQHRKELRGREDGGRRSQSSRERQDQETEVERLALDARPSGTERHPARMNRGVEIERHARDSMCKDRYSARSCCSVKLQADAERSRDSSESHITILSYYSHRNTRLEIAVKATKNSVSAATSPRCADHPRPARCRRAATPRR